MFHFNHSLRFRSGACSKHVCEKLLFDGSLITDSEKLLCTWASHFKQQSCLQFSANDSLKDLQHKIQDFEMDPFGNVRTFLNTSIDVKEVEHALRTLKPKRSGSSDNLSPEHRKHCGPIFRNWLCQIFNVCQLEQISSCFKRGIVIPCFKGKGRDPLLLESYRGITLTSVIAKMFEIILLDRMNPTFEDAGYHNPLKLHTR